MNNTALHPLEEGFRWFGPADPVPLSYIRQASAAQFHAKDSAQMHPTPLGASHFIAGGHKKRLVHTIMFPGHGNKVSSPKSKVQGRSGSRLKFVAIMFPGHMTVSGVMLCLSLAGLVGRPDMKDYW